MDANFQVVRTEDNRVDQLLDEDAALLIGGAVPHHVEIELSKEGSGLLEALGKLARLARLARYTRHLCSDRLDAAREGPLLNGDEPGAEGALGRHQAAEPSSSTWATTRTGFTETG